MYSGCLLVQLVWSLKSSLKILDRVIFGGHGQSLLGRKWDWLHQSLCEAQREPKVLSALECSFQVG